MERVAWSDALDHVAHRFQHIIARDGPDAVAFYLSGQLLTEDYYVANKLMKGFIGSANVDTNSRLCMASSVAGHRRAFGADTVPGCYEDLDEADLLVLVGSNAAWCHPVLYQRMLANKQKRGARIVVIDPRRTDTVGDDDLFLGLKPGTDTALFSGLLVHLADNGALDRDYIERAHHRLRRRDGARAQRSPAASARPRWRPALSEQDVAAFFQMFANTPRVVTLYSQGVNQSAQGTDKVNAIINCHLATGRIGKPGASPFSLTGQPNAMGGREVGGLANQLAAHMGFTPPDIDRVRRFWKAPRIATHEGLKAVPDVRGDRARRDQGAVGDGHQSGGVAAERRRRPRRAEEARTVRRFRECALQRHRRRGRACAAAGAGLGREIRHGDQFGTAHLAAARVPFRARARRKPDWWIIGEVAKRLGFGAAFGFNSAADIFREHAALSAFENDGARDFDIGALQSLSDSDFDAHGAGAVADPARSSEPQARFFAEGGFFANDLKARFIAPEIPALRDRDHGGAAAAAQHRPHPRPVAHHDPQRHEPAARPASAGAVRRGSSRRCRRARARRRRLRARHHRLRTVHASGRRQRTPAARHAVRADPLERGHRDRRAGRLAGGADHRSVLRPAREQGDAGLDRALRICVPRLCAVAHAAGAARARLVGPRRRQRRLRLSACRQRRSGGMAILAAISRDG